MEYRTFGSSDLVVSAVGMGCARLGAFWQGRSHAEAKAAVEAALSGGVTVFDTADMYARGLSERILGSTLRRRRKDCTIVTKCGLVKTPAALLRASMINQSERGPGYGNGWGHLPARMMEVARTRRCYAGGYIQRAAEASLRRLRTDYVDVLMLHSPRIDELAGGDTLPALQRLQAAGKIRYWGVSAASDEDARRALDVPGIACIEMSLNLCDGGPARNTIREAAAQGVAVIARQPFGSASVALGATIPASELGTLPEQRERDLRGRVLRAGIHFSLQAEGVSTVLIGMSRPHHVTENVAAATAVPPEADEIDRVRSMTCAGKI